MLLLLWPCYAAHTANPLVSLPARELALSLPERPGVNPSRSLELEDGSGGWLWEDGTAILAGFNALTLPPRPLALTLTER